jgi:hypothetical protein
MSAPTTAAPASVDESRPTKAAEPPKPRKSRNPSAKQMTWNAWLFLLVPGVLFVVFMALPIVMALVLSFTDYAIVGDFEWLGLENYFQIAVDPFFWIALRNTAYYTVLYVPAGLVVALGTALLLNRRHRAVRLFRTLFYIPVVASTVATAAPTVAPTPRTDPMSRIITVHPRTYNEARTIGEHFRDGVPVIMNLSEMEDVDAKRLVDFAAGLIFGLRGSIERVTSKVFLLSPPNVNVTAEDKERIAGGFFNQS